MVAAFGVKMHAWIEISARRRETGSRQKRIRQGTGTRHESPHVRGRSHVWKCGIRRHGCGRRRKGGHARQPGAPVVRLRIGIGDHKRLIPDSARRSARRCLADHVRGNRRGDRRRGIGQCALGESGPLRRRAGFFRKCVSGRRSEMFFHGISENRTFVRTRRRRRNHPKEQQNRKKIQDSSARNPTSANRGFAL